MNVRLMDWYIGKTVFSAMLIVTLCGALLMFVFTLIDAMKDAAEQGGFLGALWQTVLTLPRKIEELAPFAIFLGVLLGMGNLSSNSELTVLRSAGVSVARLFLSVCIPSVLMMALALTLVPITFDTDEGGGQKTGQAVSSAWIREGDTITRIGSFENDKLVDIKQFRLSDLGQLEEVRAATSALPNENKKGWSLHDVNIVGYGEQFVQSHEQSHATWETPRSAESLTTAFTTEPRKMSLLELYEQIDDLIAVGQDPTEFQVQFWTKLTKPLSVLGLVLIALGFVIGSTREMGMGARLTFGIMVGFTFHYFQTLIAPVTVVFSLPPVIAISVPIVLVWSMGYLLIRRVG